MKTSLKDKLIEYLISNKTLYRKELTDLVKKLGYEKSNAERRLRELCDNHDLKKFNSDNKEAKHSEWICYWKLGKIKPKTIFRK